MGPGRLRRSCLGIKRPLGRAFSHTSSSPGPPSPPSPAEPLGRDLALPGRGKLFPTAHLAQPPRPWHRNPSAQGRSLPGAKFRPQLPSPSHTQGTETAEERPGPRWLHPADARCRGTQSPHRRPAGPPSNNLGGVLTSLRFTPLRNLICF